MSTLENVCIAKVSRVENENKMNDFNSDIYCVKKTIYNRKPVRRETLNIPVPNLSRNGRLKTILNYDCVNVPKSLIEKYEDENSIKSTQTRFSNTLSSSISYENNDCRNASENFNFENKIKKVFNTMPVQIHHGGDIHRLMIEGKLGYKLKVCHLIKQIEKTLKIPANQQRIFFKGIEIQKFASTCLESISIFPNSILRVDGPSANENWMNNFIRQ